MFKKARLFGIVFTFLVTSPLVLANGPTLKLKAQEEALDETADALEECEAELTAEAPKIRVLKPVEIDGLDEASLKELSRKERKALLKMAKNGILENWVHYPVGSAEYESGKPFIKLSAENSEGRIGLVVEGRQISLLVTQVSPEQSDYRAQQSREVKTVQRPKTAFDRIKERLMRHTRHTVVVAATIAGTSGLTAFQAYQGYQAEIRQNAKPWEFDVAQFNEPEDFARIERIWGSTPSDQKLGVYQRIKARAFEIDEKSNDKWLHAQRALNDVFSKVLTFEDALFLGNAMNSIDSVFYMNRNAKKLSAEQAVVFARSRSETRWVLNSYVGKRESLSLAEAELLFQGLPESYDFHQKIFELVSKEEFAKLSPEEVLRWSSKTDADHQADFLIAYADLTEQTMTWEQIDQFLKRLPHVTNKREFALNVSKRQGEKAVSSILLMHRLLGGDDQLLFDFVTSSATKPLSEAEFKRIYRAARTSGVKDSLLHAWNRSRR